MTEQFVGRGREADIIAVSDDAVFRRYREERCVDHEVAAMRAARKFGFPVPAVLEVRPGGIVMERVSGPTMLEAAARRPWLLRRYAYVLADLHDRLHAVPPPGGLDAPFGEGDTFLHRDLHPDNVIMAADGPVVIDWSGACRGPAAVDTARTWLLLATSDVPGNAMQRTVANAGRGLFVKAFLSKVDRDAACAAVPLVAEMRLLDQAVGANERTSIGRFAHEACR
jgi:tRNA A-37 threonylcarbamoyl transferase component Bud32